VYNRFGWLLPYACQAVTVGWIASRLWRRRRGARVAG
jgi:hypothetical protein